MKDLLLGTNRPVASGYQGSFGYTPFFASCSTGLWMNINIVSGFGRIFIKFDANLASNCCIRRKSDTAFWEFSTAVLHSLSLVCPCVCNALAWSTCYLQMWLFLLNLGNLCVCTPPDGARCHLPSIKLNCTCSYGSTSPWCFRAAGNPGDFCVCGRRCF